MILPLDKSLQPGRSWHQQFSAYQQCFQTYSTGTPILVFCFYPRRKDILAGPKLETELHSMPLNSNKELAVEKNSYHLYVRTAPTPHPHRFKTDANHTWLQKLPSPMQYMRRLKKLGIREMISAKKTVTETQECTQSHQEDKKNLQKKVKAVTLLVKSTQTIHLILATLLRGIPSRGNRLFLFSHTQHARW